MPKRFYFITIMYLFSVYVNGFVFVWVYVCTTVYVCMRSSVQVLMHTNALLTCGSQGTTCRRQPSLSAIWCPRTELSAAAFRASVFAHWTTQPAYSEGAFYIMKPEKTTSRKWHQVKIRKTWLKEDQVSRSEGGQRFYGHRNKQESRMAEHNQLAT